MQPATQTVCNAKFNGIASIKCWEPLTLQQCEWQLRGDSLSVFMRVGDVREFDGSVALDEAHSLRAIGSLSCCVVLCVAR